eukprot:PhM_4_TR7909/c0_g1_i1/m.45105
MQSAYKKAMHQFFLKVHPDFFTRNKEWQRANERSVAQLNELLEWGKSFKAGQMRPPPSTRVSMSFHLKVEDDGSGGGEVTGLFEMPQPFQPTEAYKGPCERALNKFLRDILRKAKCLDSTIDSMSQSQDEVQQKIEETKKPLRRKPRAARIKTLMEDASESLSETWYPEVHPSVEDLIEADLVLFSTDLSPVQSAFALNTLQQHLSQMRYDLWYEVPLIVGKEYGVGKDVAAAISVPWDFDPETFVMFIQRNHDEIRRQKQHVEGLAQSIEQNITVVCNSCDLDDIIVSCSHKNAAGALRVLAESIDILVAGGVEKLTIEIADVFGFRNNGVVLVPHTVTQKSLAKFIDKCHTTGRFNKARTMYAAAKDMIEETMWLLKEFRANISPAGVDANFDGDYTYAERLQWARELYTVIGPLAQYDWSEFTFVLGPLDLDWDGKVVMLPSDFSGENVVRYIDSVHQDAKLKMRDMLVEQESRSKEEAHERHVAPLLNEVGASGDDNLRGEYMVSKHGDAIHTESPISARTSFEDDADIKEHLEWEGFYKNPYKHNERMIDDDDKERMYQLLNRSTREKLLNSMTEEAASKRQSRKLKMRLGDVVGLTDPNKKIAGAKITPRGTYVPDEQE